MEVLGIRFASVSKQAEEVAAFLGKTGLGMPEREMPLPPDAEGFAGAILPAGEHSWVEVWDEGPEMPVGIMLQVIVDDADEWAENARKNGLEPEGPMDMFGERIFFLTAPDGMQVSFQSKFEPTE
jgi:hypothetical protein